MALGLAGDSVPLSYWCHSRCVWVRQLWPDRRSGQHPVRQEPVLQRSLEGWDLQKQLSSILWEVLSILRQLYGWNSYLEAQRAPAIYVLYHLAWIKPYRQRHRRTLQSWCLLSIGTGVHIPYLPAPNPPLMPPGNLLTLSLDLWQTAPDSSLTACFTMSYLVCKAREKMFPLSNET